jgi:hypothetical protein
LAISGPLQKRNGIRKNPSSVGDPDPGSGAFLIPGSGMGKNPEPGSGIRDEHPGSYF